MANKLFVSRYLTLLPSAEQLQRFVETDRARFEAAMAQHAGPARNLRRQKANRRKPIPSRPGLLQP